MAAPAIGARKRWSPGRHARIDPGHPLSAGLVFCDWFPNGSPIETGATTLGVVSSSALGVGIGSVALTGYASYATSQQRYIPSGALTHIIVGAWSLGSGTYASRVVGNNSGEVTFYRSGSEMRCYFDPGTGLPSGEKTLKTSAAGLLLTLGMSATNSGSVFYCDGAQVGTAGTTTIDTVPSSVLAIGHNTSAASGLIGVCNFYGIWNRALSAAEHAMVWADPFCMLRA